MTKVIFDASAKYLKYQFREMKKTRPQFDYIINKISDSNYYLSIEPAERYCSVMSSLVSDITCSLNSMINLFFSISVRTSLKRKLTFPTFRHP